MEDLNEIIILNGKRRLAREGLPKSIMHQNKRHTRTGINPHP
jgi:hypothetical protein